MFDTAYPSFYLSANLTVDIEEFLYIGSDFNDDTKEMDGAAIFLVDYATLGPSLLVEIDADIYIPLLRTTGSIKVNINDDGAALEGSISFLDGLLTPIAIIEWDWAFTRFYAELGDMPFVPGILELNQLVLNVTTQPDLILGFKIDITVLSFADLGATLLLEEKGTDLYVAFTLVADLKLVETTVKGDATLDLTVVRSVHCPCCGYSFS